MMLLKFFTGQAPVSQTWFKFLQASHVEAKVALAASLVPPGITKAVLKGCLVTDDGTNTTIAPGWMFWDDGTTQRLIRVPGNTVSATGIANLKLVLTEGTPTGFKPFLLFRNNVARQVYREETLQLAVGTSLGVGEDGFRLQELNYRYQSERPGDLFIMHPRPGFVMSDSFDVTTGLGKNYYLGYALCDGRNDTPDYRGRTPIGWVPQTDAGEADVRLGGEYETVGEPYGKRLVGLEEQHLPEHDHPIPKNADTDGAPSDAVYRSGQSGATGLTALKTGKTGGNQAHENRQPSRVAVIYQKL